VAIGVAVGIVANRLAVDAEPDWFSGNGFWDGVIIVLGVPCALLGGLGAWFGFLRSTDPFERLGAPVLIGASVLGVTWSFFVQANPLDTSFPNSEGEVFFVTVLIILPAVLVAFLFLSWPFPLGFLIGQGIRRVTDLTGWEPRPKPDSVALWARPSLTLVWAVHLGVRLSRAWRRVRPSTRARIRILTVTIITVGMWMKYRLDLFG
jgi:hypothetical protein